jgi:hypothetical protein
MVKEILSMFILTFFLENKGIFFMLLAYSHLFRDKASIRLSILIQRLSILIPWLILLLYVDTSLLDIILFLIWISIKEIIKIIKK